jgi:transglutaminase-like putative cysteine protease
MRLFNSTPVTATSRAMRSGVAGVFQTLRRMRDEVIAGRRSMTIRNAALSIVFLQPEKNEYQQANALFEFVRDNIKYIKDIHEVETISTAEKTLESKVGDCDDQCILLASLAESVGIPSMFVVAGYTTLDSFEHVYPRLFVDGMWVDCDPTESNVFGWAPPDPLIYAEEF